MDRYAATPMDLGNATLVALAEELGQRRIVAPTVTSTSIGCTAGNASRGSRLVSLAIA
jgi:hypothetical protein